MCRWPSLVEMVSAQSLFDLPQRLRPFRFRLPFPVEGESLTAHAATGLNLFLAALAKYLHVSDPLWPGGVYFAHRRKIAPFNNARTFPIGASRGPLAVWANPTLVLLENPFTKPQTPLSLRKSKPCLLPRYRPPACSRYILNGSHCLPVSWPEHQQRSSQTRDPRGFCSWGEGQISK